MVKKVNNIANANNSQVPKQKGRHIVSWSQEEDDILREQIRLHGTENWTIIASKFKDKTTRQCRRRWFTYLNSDFKKGGWSPEEDMLLCEAQKIFGNRWTEIAKVVSGRTDNAVKNRFTTLCKKRAKQEAFAKENSTTSFINLNNKRVIFPNGLVTDGGSENTAPYKKLRTYIKEHCTQEEKFGAEDVVSDHLLRPPFAVLAQDVQSSEAKLTCQLHVGDIKEASIDGSVNDKAQGTFLKTDNPKVIALMQQAELLSILAIKINSEKTGQSLENAWTKPKLVIITQQVLQDFLKQIKESDLLASRNLDTDFQFEKLEMLTEGLRSGTESSRSSSRENDVYELSPASSEYSTGSTLLSNAPCDKMDGFQAEMSKLHQENTHELQSDQLKDQHCLIEEKPICHSASTTEAKDMMTCNDTKAKNGSICEYSNAAFSSPLHVTPQFGSWAAAIPSPIFSESKANRVGYSAPPTLHDLEFSTRGYDKMSDGCQVQQISALGSLIPLSFIEHHLRNSNECGLNA